MKVSKEFQVGLLTLISGAILYFGFNYLKGINMFSSSHYFYAEYDQIDGLQVSNPVMVNGLVVGRVSNISILQDQGNKMQVEFEVESNIEVGNESEAHLTDNGLLGGKMIDLKLNKGTGVLEDYSTIKSMREVSMTSTLQEQAAPLMSSADSVMVNVNRLLKDYASMSGDVKSMVRDASETMRSTNAIISNNQQKIAMMLENFAKVSAKLGEQQKQLDPILAKMNEVGDSLTQIEVSALVSNMQTTVAELNKTLKTINEAEGTMSKVMKDEALYDNMNQTLQDLDSLFIDLKEHPKRYVHFSLFGRKDKEKKK